MMKLLLRASFLYCLLNYNVLQSQTTISAGSVTGTWQKSGSPYKVNGNIYIPKGSKLTITEGVTVEFQGNYKLDAWGTIQVLGKANDTVVFTAKDKTAGWLGIAVHSQLSASDSILFDYTKLEYKGNQNINVQSSNGSALMIDSCYKVRISNSVFSKNSGFPGSCGKFRNSRLVMYKTRIEDNFCCDRTQTMAGSSASCGMIFLQCRSTISDCFANNNFTVTPNYQYPLASGVLVFYDSFARIKNCMFKNCGSKTITNRVASGVDFGGKFWDCQISNCQFESNTVGVVIFDLNKAQFNGNYIENCNNSFSAIYAAVSSNLTSASILIDSTLILNCNKELFVASQQSYYPFFTIKRLSYFNNNKGISFRKSNFSLQQSMICNNKFGLLMDDGTGEIINTNFSNNKSDSTGILALDTMSPSIQIGDGCEMYVYNSIFSGNYSVMKKTKNINVFYEQIPSSLYINNSLVEGGKSSIQLNNKNSLKNYSNIIESSSLFVSPTAGAGPSYDASLADWHPLNTCSGLSKTFNAGTSALPFGASLPAYDIDGKARVAQGRVDIGPYEIQSNILPRVFTQPRDTAFCANATSNMMPFTAMGANMNYSWQSSADGNVWSALGSQSTNQLNSIKVPQAGPVYYRSIIINPNCSKGDTTRSTMLTVNPLPKPNLGADQTIANGGSVVLNPGSFTSYNWYKGATTPTYTADKSNLDTGKNKVWVEVTDSKGCKGRDTVIIDLRPVNGLRSITEAGIKLYPVPTNDELTIEVPNNQTYSYEIRDLQGKAIISKTRINTTATKVNLKDLPVGVYVIVIGIEGDYYSGKLIKR